MQHEVTTILQNLAALNANPTPHRIDIDLMLEQTRELYGQLLAMQNQHPIATPGIATIQTEIIETELPETAVDEPEVEIRPAALIQKLHISAHQEPTLEDLIPETPEQAHEAHNSLPPIADVPEEFIPQMIVAQPAVKMEHDIRKLIGINDKYQYISELFGNDKETYEIVLTKLNKFDNYADAVTWMDEVHTENRWGDEHPTVISFYELMSQFFASR